VNGVFFYSVATTQQDRAASADNGGLLAIQGDSPALAGVDSTEQCTIELTPREMKLVLKYGYPFPDDAARLRASPRA
jgi:hypothetical protein